MGFPDLFHHRKRSSGVRKARPGRRQAQIGLEELESRSLLSTTGLNTFVAQTYHHVISPSFTAGQTPGGYWPSQIRHAYGFDQLALDGSGETIAIVDAFHDPNLVSDLGVFNKQFNLPLFNNGTGSPTLTQVNETGGDPSSLGTDPAGDWEVEEVLDVEWAHAIAPKANILVVESTTDQNNDLLAAVDYARNAPGVVVVSMSWGGNEFPGENTTDTHFVTPAGHPGVTFVASSGDSGQPAGWPAVSPNILAVGGTTLQLSGSDTRTSEVGWSYSGGGYSMVYTTEPAYQSSYAQSSYVQNTLNNKVLLNTVRANPDVSYEGDPNTGLAMYNTFPSTGSVGWIEIGGTSVGAPQWAGLIALVDQGRGAAGPLDGPNQTLPGLYQLGSSSTSYPSDFYDITSGKNTPPGSTIPSSAQPGYDLVTGLGSPQAANLIPDLMRLQGSTAGGGGISFGPAPSYFSVTASPSSTAGTAFSITVTAQDSSHNTLTGYVGTVHFSSSDSSASLPANYTFTAADNGVHTFSNGVTLLKAGSQSITAADTATTSAIGSATISVSPAAASTMVFSGLPSSFTAGTPGSFTLTAQDAYGNAVTGYAGTVHFSSSDAQVSAGNGLPADYTFTTGTGGDNGQHTFSATLKTAGTQSLTATDAKTSTITGTQSGLVVNPTTASALSLSAPSSNTQNALFSVTVTARDPYGNTASGYRGTVNFTTSDTGTGVVLPANYSFTAADNGVHTFTNGFVLATLPSQTVTVNDTGSSGILGSSATVQVTAPQPATHLGVSVSSSVNAGSPFSITVTPLDASNNSAPGYTGTVTFSGSDAQAVLPGNYTFTASDHGVHTFTGTFKTAGSQTITVKDTTTSSITGSTSTTVNPAAASTLVVGGFPSPIIAGTSGSFSVTARDAYGNTATGYGGTVHFSSSDSQAVLPANSTLTNGSGTFNAILKTVGTQTLTATDTGNSSITGTQSGITVNPVPVPVFSSASSTTFAAGTAGSFTVITTGTPTAALSVSGTLPSGVSFTDNHNGTATLAGTPPVGSANSFPLTLTATNSAGTATQNFTLNVQDGVTQGNWQWGTYGLQGYDLAQIVSGLPTYVTSFSMSGQSNYVWASSTTDPRALYVPGGGQEAATWYGSSNFSASMTTDDGLSHRVALYLVDWDNQGRKERVDLLDSSGHVLAGQTVSNFSGGVYIGFTFTNYATLRITNLAGPNAVLSGLFFGFPGTPPASPPVAPASFNVTASSSNPSAGATDSITVTAQDSSHNTLTGYTGTVHVSSSDSTATLPANYTFTAADNGVHTFSVVLHKAGPQSVTAADTATSSATGSVSVTVNPAAASQLAVSGYLSPTTAGTSQSFTVTAQDPYGNTATGYTGTVGFSSSDKQAVLPSSSTLSNGTGTFSATLKTAGTESLTATDTASPSITGTQSGITVNPAAASTLVVAGFPSSIAAGTSGSFSVTAKDAYGNTATGYGGTVHFSSSDSQAVLPADSTLTSGTGTFNATLKTVGTQSLTATDKASSTIAGTQAGITVTSAPTPPPTPSYFSVTASPSSTAGTAFSITVTAQDSSHNTLTGYVGTVHFSSSDSSASLPANYTFTAADNGMHTFSNGVTLLKAGSQTVSAADTVATSATGSTTVTVNPAAASTLVVSGFPSSINAGTSGSFSVTARDAYGNTATGYAGTVHFTSSDAAAVLPADSTLTSGTRTFSATLKTAGTQSLTATDTVTSTIKGTQSGITVNSASPVPVFTSASSTTFMSKTAGTFTITTTGTPAPALSESSNVIVQNLPSGVTFTDNHNGTATLAGTPLAGSANSFPLTLTATNSAGTATQTFTLNVQDAVTQGTWQSGGYYGLQGYYLAGMTSSPINFGSVTFSGQSNYVWTYSTTDVRALQNPSGGREAGTWYSNTNFSVTISMNDGLTHRVALYLVDWDNQGRSERIDVLDSSGKVQATQTVSNFSGGVWVGFPIKNYATLRITNLAAPNAVLSGLFFGYPTGPLIVQSSSPAPSSSGSGASPTSGTAGNQVLLSGSNSSGGQAVSSSTPASLTGTGSTARSVQTPASQTGTARTEADTSAPSPADPFTFRSSSPAFEGHAAPSTTPPGATESSGQGVHGVDLFFAWAGAGQQQGSPPPSPLSTATTTPSGRDVQSVDLLMTLARLPRRHSSAVVGPDGGSSVSEPDDGGFAAT